MHAIRPLLLPLALMTACAPAAEAERPSHSIVFRQLTFARAVDGVSNGFDLDGLATQSGDETGCGQGDFTGPDGAAGIDNATARLLPLLEVTEAAAVEPIIQQEINNGGLLLVLELVGLADPSQDGTVDVVLRHGQGTPWVGTDGFLVPGQTIDDDPAVGTFTVPDVAWRDGALVAADFEIVVPVVVFDFDAEFYIQDAMLEVRRGDDGLWSGMFAGRVDWQGLMTTVQESGIDDTLADSLPGILTSLSDLRDANGDCLLLSATLEFEASDVYVYEGG
jgi:hypothetical protein